MKAQIYDSKAGKWVTLIVDNCLLSKATLIDTYDGTSEHVYIIEAWNDDPPLGVVTGQIEIEEGWK